MRLDTFIGENWTDTKAIQREFVNAIVKIDSAPGNNARNCE